MLNSLDVRFFAELGVVLQDRGAHKAVWHSKGGSRTCIRACYVKTFSPPNLKYAILMALHSLHVPIASLRISSPRRPRASGIKLVILSAGATPLTLKSHRDHIPSAHVPSGPIHGRIC